MPVRTVGARLIGRRVYGCMDRDDAFGNLRARRRSMVSQGLTRQKSEPQSCFGRGRRRSQSLPGS